ncbi:HAD family phosphatase [Phenylobacterium sp.]|jgi:2-haloacid dehalogenase/putative hydrolase of the HAD superfamily|uniref:HAD family hydrolase n=1 Tax=Phenylobacterium sp. TaxID=1871053 RepID=UPI002E32FBDB|nr:HAD family phosphatase [Phenylobacterium sp.]HEX2561074.1 HAD family phosphatase [Phenylobacterium sp.]
MPKAVLWDIGNVIVRWDPRTLYSKIFPDPAERDRFLAEICTMAWHEAHDLGVRFEDNRAELIARFPDHEAAICAWGERWWEMFSGPIAETEAAIEALHARGVPQHGLSNISQHTLEGTFAMSPAFGRLQGVVISGAEGLIKPDPAIFRLACERFGHAPQDVLFIDDGPRNIEAARTLGFDVHHFTDPAQLRPALEARGLL